MVQAFNALLECAVTAGFVVFFAMLIENHYARKEQEYLTSQAQKHMDGKDDE